MPPFHLRVATENDVQAVLGIYGWYVRHTAITFETAVPALSDFAARYRTIRQSYPYLVCERDGVVIGYAYAQRHMERSAYQWNAELSVYLDKDARGGGAGSALYRALIRLCAMQNIHTVIGCVTVPNPASERLHASLGFERYAYLARAGYKMGRWHDVAWFARRLQGKVAPKPLRALEPSEVDAVLRTAG